MRLIDADALSESIRSGPGTDVQKLFADVCVATAPTVDANPTVRWIPVTEGLPETADEFVLVCVSGKPTKCITLHGALELACYSPHCGWILENWPDWENANVTHWAPLPEPPEVVQGG